MTFFPVVIANEVKQSLEIAAGFALAMTLSFGHCEQSEAISGFRYLL
jgi:hypothetical protein